MAVISMKALLESGVHFGHRTNKWHPGMKPYIFTERNGIHIIDLQQTVKSITTAYNAIRDCVSGGGMVLFVGTKRQAQETVRDESVRCGMPYVTERWLGGMLTNWTTMYQRIQELERMEKVVSSGEVERLTKKEGLLIQREINRLNIRLSGVRSINHTPDMVFIVDVMREEAAVHEANLLKIPVVALVDTNCDPSHVDYVIPSNDDAIRAIKLLVAKIADAVLEGKAMRKDEELEQAAELKLGAESALEREYKPVAALDLDEELGDDQLLGEATLAKLTPHLVAEVAPEAPVEVPAEVVVEAESLTEATEEPAEVVAEAESLIEATEEPAEAVAEVESKTEATEEPKVEVEPKGEEEAK